MMNFPDTPANGDLFTANGCTYVWRSSPGLWDIWPAMQKPGGQMVREVILGAPINTISLPSLGMTTVDIFFQLGSTSADTNVFMNMMNGGTVNTTASAYYTLRRYAVNTTPSHDELVAANFILGTATTNQQVYGRVLLPNMTASSLGMGHFTYGYSGGNVIVDAGLTGPGGDGLYFSIAAGNFYAGSTVRIIGWP